MASANVVSEMGKDIEYVKAEMNELKTGFSAYRLESRKERGIIHKNLNKLAVAFDDHKKEEAELIRKGLFKVILILLTILGVIASPELLTVIKMLR